MDSPPELSPDQKPPAKPQVVRGARACTVCRAAKMKCVGAEDGQKQCQRCKRANVEFVIPFSPLPRPPHPCHFSRCVFEKHRRGRKPGSKSVYFILICFSHPHLATPRLSEASKMLRRLEKDLNSAKLKTQPNDPGMSAPYSSPEARNIPQDAIYSAAPPAEPTYVPAPHYPPAEQLPPLNVPSHPPPPAPAPPPPTAYPTSATSSHTMDVDEDDDPDKSDTPPYPAKLIKQTQRNSFFRIILNAEEAPISTSSSTNRGPSHTPPQSNIAPTKPVVPDPISAGFITEEDASLLFDALFLRLNPFINLFDPQLHTHTYVRNRCPFLFTTLIAAAAKFFKPEVHKVCQKLANDLAVRAFQEAWKSVEVVQAFACLTYWRNTEDNRTWTYIGYACRMAVDLGLNRYSVVTPPNESTLQKLERRNRERTYLVLFIHDRSLSTQTGRHWMLPENDDLIENSGIWHRHGVDDKVRPEDVIIAGFVELRRIAAETTDVFNTSKGAGANDINYEVVLRNCNAKLNKWSETWRFEMGQAKGESFHFSFLKFFRLYVRVFLNYFGIASGSSGGRQHHSVQAHSICYSSSKESLQIVTKEFTSLSMLVCVGINGLYLKRDLTIDDDGRIQRYGQETITVMTAYSAIILLKLLRSPTSPKEVVDTEEVYSLILKTAEAYDNAGGSANNAVVHARFLRSLVDDDRHRFGQRDGGIQIDPRLQGQNNPHGSAQNSPTQTYPHQASASNREVYYAPAPHVQQQQQQQAAPPIQVHQQPPPPPPQPQQSPPQQHPQPHTGTVTQQNGEYYEHTSADMTLRNGGVNNNNVNGNAGGNANGTSMQQYYTQNPYYFMGGSGGGGGGMHATEQDQSYYKHMFIELGFGEPNPPAAAQHHPHQGSMAYAHHMPQHANYGQ
ncbi:hypothetical protein D9756_001799 [Leucocoprinus leucothites]|uniref:Zn(2)-C6 fungal-type domain-containing protein n=1 Tax=Leucocoprinus leucothites TaxID=201217 RepID=A0A8H5G4P5_9AGAR|nr:hypothetical protein D9756_001799 [Leucoagaricus leucothites]